MDITKLHFKDDGVIPNSTFPLLIYKHAITDDKATADFFEALFERNNWSNSWRNGVFSYHHYHSITHEVLGVYEGSAELQLGGEKGDVLHVNKGDVIIIPAGVGHKKKTATADFAVVGAYPNGMDFDLLTGKQGDRPKADQNIKNVPFPETHPVFGHKKGLIEFWK